MTTLCTSKLLLHSHLRELCLSLSLLSILLFFFNDTAPTEIYTLSLHDALPISHAHHTSEWAGSAAREYRQHDLFGGHFNRFPEFPYDAGAREIGRAHV